MMSNFLLGVADGAKAERSISRARQRAIAMISRPSGDGFASGQRMRKGENNRYFFFFFSLSYSPNLIHCNRIQDCGCVFERLMQDRLWDRSMLQVSDQFAQSN